MRKGGGRKKGRKKGDGGKAKRKKEREVEGKE